MLKRSLLLSLLVALATLVQAGSIKGKVVDGTTRGPLDFVNIALYQDDSNKLQQGVVTDSDGQFSFEGLVVGNYRIEISFIGYSSINLPVILTQKKPDADLGNLILKEESKTLGEVQVTGQKAQMKLEIDKRVFNVDQSISTAGAGASDVLRNIPSVNVDAEGNVALRNNSSVEIWINGRPSGLDEDNRAQVLAQMPAESIDRIEVITNPSSRYSPEGSAGIINIILKKDRKAGYYGSVAVGGDTFGGYNVSGNINYSSKKWDANAMLGFRSMKFISKGESERETTVGEDTQILNSDSKSEMAPLGLFFRGGATYHITDKDHLGMTLMVMNGDHSNDSEYSYTGTREFNRNNTSDGYRRMMDIGINYQREIGKDHELMASVSVNGGRSGEDVIYDQFTALTESHFYQKQNSETERANLQFQVDYSKKFSDFVKIETGLKGEHKVRNSLSEGFDGSDKNNISNYVNSLYNDYDNTEGIDAIYLNVAGRYKSFGYQAGLRGEYTMMDATNLFKDESGVVSDPFKRNYFDLFPTLFLSYELPKGNEMQFNITRRINRPRGRMLSSYRNVSDSTNISIGNPNLQPEYTTAFELNYLKNWDNHTLTSSLYYRTTNDGRQNITYVEDGTMYSTWDNISNMRNYGLELVAKNRLFKMLDLTTSLNLFYNQTDGFTYKGTTYKSTEDFSWNAQMIANLMLPAGFMFQVTGRYDSERRAPQSVTDAMYSVDLGLRKSFLNRKLNVSLAARDIFESRTMKTTTWGNNFNERSERLFGGRMLSLTLTYNFGNTGAQRKKRQNGDNDMDMMNGDF
ncbi:MAG: TonB-dependent receptor domain-containing protein [Bacteroidales bacterium]